MWLHLPGCWQTWADRGSMYHTHSQLVPHLPSSLTIFKHNFLENGAAHSEDNWLGGEGVCAESGPRVTLYPSRPCHRVCLATMFQAGRETKAGAQ